MGEELAAQRRRPRDLAGVQRQRDQELLRAVAAEHGEVAPVAGEPRLLGAQEGADGAGALRPGRRAEEAHGAVLRAGARPDLLGLAHPVVGHEPGAGLDDGPRAPVVGAQGVGRRPRLGRHAPVELEDAARVGLPPAVDELVVVAHDEEPAMRPGEHVHERQLRPVEVLELVHQHVVEPSLDEGAVRGIGEHVGDGEVDLVVEGLQTGRGLGAHVLRVGGRERDGDDGRVGDALDLDVDVGDGLERGPDPGQPLHERADWVAAAPRLELAQGHAGGLHGPGHERPQRAAVVVEREAGPQDLALVPVAEGVEGGAVHARRALRGGGAGTPPPGGSGVRRRAEAARGADAEGGETLLELFGRLAVEGEHEDAGGIGAAVDELDDAAHQGLGLARAGRREDACGAADVLDCGALGVVEPRRVGAGGRARRRAWLSRSRRCGGPRWGCDRGSASEAAPASSRPMSSRSSAAASPTPRLRGASTRSPKEKPMQNGRPRPTSGWMKRSSTSPACAANSSAVPFQNQSPTGGSPPSSDRPGSPGSPVQSRRAAKRTPGAAAAARCARSRRLETSKNSEPGTGDHRARKGGGGRSSDRLSVAVLMGGTAGSACSPGRPQTLAGRSGSRARVTRVDVRAPSGGGASGDGDRRRRPHGARASAAVRPARRTARRRTG